MKKMILLLCVCLIPASAFALGFGDALSGNTVVENNLNIVNNCNSLSSCIGKKLWVSAGSNITLFHAIIGRHCQTNIGRFRSRYSYNTVGHYQTWKIHGKEKKVYVIEKISVNQ